MWNRSYQGRHSADRVRTAVPGTESVNDEKFEIVIDSAKVETDDQFEFLEQALSA
jgi:hypothetical protein